MRKKPEGGRGFGASAGNVSGGGAARSAGQGSGKSVKKAAVAKTQPSLAARRALFQATTGQTFKPPAVKAAQAKPTKKAPPSRSAIQKFLKEQKKARKERKPIPTEPVKWSQQEVARRIAIDKRRSRQRQTETGKPSYAPGTPNMRTAARIKDLSDKASAAAARGDNEAAAAFRRLAAELQRGKGGAYRLNPGKGSDAFSKTQKPALSDRTVARIKDLQRQAVEATRRGDAQAAAAARARAAELKRGGGDPQNKAAREMMRPPSEEILYRTPRGFGKAQRQPRKGPGRK